MLNKKCILIGLILASFLLVSVTTHAATITATSCSQADVQSAINGSKTGDSVLVPSGSCSWTAGVNIPTSKKIKLQGAGKDTTIITMPGTAIFMNESGSRITEFGFVLSGGSGIINVQGTNWRIDNCKFNNTTGGSAVAIESNARNVSTMPKGLIENNVFVNGRILVNGFYTFAKMCEAWKDELNLGTDDAVYIENNTFTRTDGCSTCNVIDANRGSKYVFRFNTVTNSYIEAHSLQSDVERATRKWEIYNNKIGTDFPIYATMRLRGGTGVVFNNIISGPYTLNIAFDIVRAYTSVGTAGLCNGSSNWDKNFDTTGWMCRDQVGTSKDSSLWTGETSPPYQTRQPAYLWFNRNGSNILNVSVINSSSNHIRDNRDYYNEVTNFNGTFGVGVGTLANRPQTCTMGVAYWATDQGSWNKSGSGGQGVLYSCTETNKWALFYTPYVYPHQLTYSWGTSSFGRTPEAPFTIKVD